MRQTHYRPVTTRHLGFGEACQLFKRITLGKVSYDKVDVETPAEMPEHSGILASIESNSDGMASSVRSDLSNEAESWKDS